MNIELKRIRELEKRALSIGALCQDDIKTTEEMKYEAWECYLVSQREFLEHLIADKELED